MQYDEPPYDRFWVINTRTAAELLPDMLIRFRLGYLDPIIFGDGDKAEGAIVPIELLRALDTRSFDGAPHPVRLSDPSLPSTRPANPA